MRLSIIKVFSVVGLVIFYLAAISNAAKSTSDVNIVLCVVIGGFITVAWGIGMIAMVNGNEDRVDESDEDDVALYEDHDR